MQFAGAALTRLLQLASPLLPVGAYSYSQGLEWAVEQNIISDQATARRWIRDALHSNLGRFEAPLLHRMQLAWQAGSMQEVSRLNRLLAAARECAEFRAETLQMGYSLVRLLQDLGDSPEEDLNRLSALEPVSFPAAYSFAAAAWQVPEQAALNGYLWSWAENQVSAAMKTVPLGQVAGQRILGELAGAIPAVAAQAMTLPEAEWSNFAPMLAIAGSRHEMQYSRLFRS
jgi:urease accessory protein